MEDEPGSAPSLRASNRLRVIQALQLSGVTSRADLARHTGLSRSTVSTIVAGLQAEGIVVDRDADGRPRGRRPAAGADRARPLGRASRSASTSASATCGRARGPLARAARRGVARDDGRLRRRGRHRAGGRSWWRGCSRRRARTRAALLGVGMGLPGPVHSSGVVGSSAILPGWAGTQRRRAHGRPARPWRSGSATTRTSARSRSPPGAPGAAPRHRLPQAGDGHRRRHRDRRPTVRGAGGTAGEIGHTLARRDGRHLPLREPRLPRDLRKRHGDRRAAQPQPRRAARPSTT